MATKAKTPQEPTLIAVDASLSSHVEDLIVRNRTELIKASVKDAATQRELLAVSEAIQKIGARSPELVAAWGLGCGGSCLVGPEILRGDPIRFRSK